MLKSIVVISLGGAAACLMRWLPSSKLNSVFAVIPFGTLTANLVGCYLIGVAIAYLGTHPMRMARVATVPGDEIFRRIDDVFHLFSGSRFITKRTKLNVRLTVENNMNSRRMKHRVSHPRSSYLNGLEHWQESLTLMILLTLLCVLGLNNSGVDEWLLELLKWVGTDCSWCTIHPS